LAVISKTLPMNKIQLFLLFLVFALISGCKKQDPVQSTCDNIQKATIAYNSPVTIGDTVHFETQEVGGYRIYSWIGPHNFTSQEPVNTIFGADLENEGWYYLDLFSANGSCQKIDSFYLDVKLKQGTPSCTVAANTTSYNNLAGDSYTSATKGIDPNFSQKSLLCFGSNSSMTVYFHTHWRTKEPEDGIYYTINTPLFDQTDDNYNKVFITTTKQSIYWASYEGQVVYISHAGSKLQVRFCQLSLAGNNGNSFTTIASGNLLEK